MVLIKHVAKRIKLPNKQARRTKRTAHGSSVLILFLLLLLFDTFCYNHFFFILFSKDKTGGKKLELKKTTRELITKPQFWPKIKN